KTSREPKPRQGAERNDHEKDHKEQDDTDLLKIADDRGDRSAEKVACPGEHQNPDKTADEIQKQKAGKRHSPDPVKDTHSGPDAVDIFRDDYRECTELVDELFDPRLGHLIEAVMLGFFMEDATDAVRNVVARHSAQRSEKQHLGKAVLSEKSPLCHRPRNQKGDVAFDHTESKNRVNTIFRDYV